MPPEINGQRTTLNIDTRRIKIDAEPKIALFDPQATPLAVAISTIGREYVKDDNGMVKVTGVPFMKKVTTAPRFDWWEDQLVGFKSNSTAAYLSTDTAITVVDGTVYNIGDIVWNSRTSELMEVNGAPSGNVVTFRRGVGSSGTGIAINANDELMVIGNAYPEGAASRQAKTTKEVNNYNFTQIIRTSVEITRTLMNTNTYTEDEWQYEVKKTGVEHLKKIERTLWFGKREESTDSANNTSGAPKRTTGGIINQFILTNIFTAPSTLTEADFNSFLETALKNGSTMKYVFCAPRVLTVISNFAQGRLRTAVDDTIYGLTIHEYQSPHGLIKLVRQPIFDESVQTSGTAVAIDMQNMKYRYLQNSDTTFLDNRQNNDVDGKKGEYLTEMGLEFQLEKEAAMLVGVRG